MAEVKEAMLWWNGLSSLRKTQICDTNTELVGSVHRWETLTDEGIEVLYNNGRNPDIEIAG